MPSGFRKSYTRSLVPNMHERQRDFNIPSTGRSDRTGRRTNRVSAKGRANMVRATRAAVVSKKTVTPGAYQKLARMRQITPTQRIVCEVMLEVIGKSKDPKIPFLDLAAGAIGKLKKKYGMKMRTVQKEFFVCTRMRAVSGNIVNKIFGQLVTEGILVASEKFPNANTVVGKRALSKLKSSADLVPDAKIVARAMIEFFSDRKNNATTRAQLLRVMKAKFKEQTFEFDLRVLTPEKLGLVYKDILLKNNLVVAEGGSVNHYSSRVQKKGNWEATKERDAQLRRKDPARSPYGVKPIGGVIGTLRKASISERKRRRLASEVLQVLAKGEVSSREEFCRRVIHNLSPNGKVYTVKKKPLTLGRVWVEYLELLREKLIQ